MLADPPPRQPPQALPPAPANAKTPPRIDSATLLGAAGEVLIVHQQQVYRLRRTSLGKLILTK
jgi:hemin uptake protein HemP